LLQFRYFLFELHLHSNRFRYSFAFYLHSTQSPLSELTGSTSQTSLSPI
jgi:hypothetical protein